ncbi:TlpA family protein disulfide reductase [bacterium]|nr:TlpA family protein disulfide reductase [bacterium]
MRPYFAVFLLFLTANAWSQSSSGDPASYLDPDGRNIPVYEGFDTILPELQAPDEGILVINFWATWCAPCVAELPYFEELRSRYPSGQVRVLLVSLDFPKQLEKRLLPFLEKKDIHSSVVVLDDPDANSWIDRVSPEWSGAIPATLILGPGIREFREQSFTRKELFTLVQSLVESLP